MRPPARVRYIRRQYAHVRMGGRAAVRAAAAARHAQPHELRHRRARTAERAAQLLCRWPWHPLRMLVQRGGILLRQARAPRHAQVRPLARAARVLARAVGRYRRAAAASRVERRTTPDDNPHVHMAHGTPPGESASGYSIWYIMLITGAMCALHSTLHIATRRCRLAGYFRARAIAGYQSTRRHLRSNQSPARIRSLSTTRRASCGVTLKIVTLFRVTIFRHGVVQTCPPSACVPPPLSLSPLFPFLEDVFCDRGRRLEYAPSWGSRLLFSV